MAKQKPFNNLANQEKFHVVALNVIDKIIDYFLTTKGYTIDQLEPYQARRKAEEEKLLAVRSQMAKNKM
jgi:hypothetical protein